MFVIVLILLEDAALILLALLVRPLSKSAIVSVLTVMMIRTEVISPITMPAFGCGREGTWGATDLLTPVVWKLLSQILTLLMVVKSFSVLLPPFRLYKNVVKS